MEKQKQLPDLSGFNGTNEYHYLNFLKNLKFTDGWAHLAKEIGCFWLSDIVASVQHLDKIKENDFILWVINVKDKKAIVKALTDTDGDVLYEQKIDYTDFPEGDFGWYQCGDVVMLKGNIKMNKCFNCGKLNRDDLDVCSDCGEVMFEKGEDLRKGEFENKERGYF